MASNSGRKKLLVLDFDSKTLLDVTALAKQWYDVLTTREPEMALSWLSDQTSISVLVTENITGTFKGLNFLDRVRVVSPDTRRVVATAFTDLAMLVEGLHSGAIQKLVQKPILRNELLAAIAPEALTSGAGGFRKAG